MTSKVLLIDLPDIPMKHLLRLLDYRSIQVLRKVCHDLRNFTDDVIHPSSIKEISINFYHNRVHLKYLENGIRTELRYRFHNKGCSVIWYDNQGKRLKGMENMDFLSCFWRDFEILLRHQKTILEKFEMLFRYSKKPNEEPKFPEENLVQLMENFGNNLKSRTHPLQIKTFDLEISQEFQIMSILPYIDSKCIEGLTVYIEKGTMIRTEGIVNSEQWKNLKKSCGIFYFEDEIEKGLYTHVSIGKYELDKISRNIIEGYMDEFLSFSLFKQYQLHYNEIEADYPLSEQLEFSFGYPFIDESDQKLQWFFRFPGSGEDVLAMSFSETEHLFTYKRMQLKDLPLGAGTRRRYHFRN